MFLGQHTLKPDAKGKVTLPKGYLPFLAGGLVLTAGFDGSLVVFPEADWQALAERVIGTALTNGRARTLRRHLFANAVRLTPDKNGRIPLPAHLRHLAGIDDQLIIIGLYNYLEIWSPRAWQNAQTETAVTWEGLPI
ncbi:MAG: division/cell wall cluster transcriptional repressor MraZ [Anaerolineae bacterium]